MLSWQPEKRKTARELMDHRSSSLGVDQQPTYFGKIKYYLKEYQLSY